MKAVLMAGGEGSRLRPLTINRPKPMVPIVDRQVIGHIIELLKIHGITDIIITVQYLANVIQDEFGDGTAYEVNIEYSVEEQPLGTAGSVKNAENLLKEPFLVISGDALTDFDLSKIIAAHDASGAMATLTLTRVPNPLEYGVIIIDEDGHVRQFLEKPSWGEVFSDTVNTGIYVLNPEVFKYIEKGKVSDWSKDIFPHMLHKDDKIMGYVAEGYWTDVGTIEEYMRANHDYLSGKVNLPRVGYKIFDDVWVDGDAEIAPDAQFNGPVYLGHGAKIKGGVIIHGPSAIRNYTVVDTRATIDRSVLWRNSYVGERAELRGAIVLRQCNIKRRAVLFEGVVVGDQTIINAGAVIGANVKIWPSKEIDEGATITTSIIWGSQGRRVLFGRYGITGLVNIDLTPEFCAKLGAAFGATLQPGSNVIMNRDAHYTSRMLKRAIIAGLPSAGVNVLELHSVPIPVARYITHAMGAAGGVHLRLSPLDNRVVDIKFFDSHGLDIDTPTERKIEGVFFREDYRRVYLDEIGRIVDTENIEQMYTDAFLRSLRPEALPGLSKDFNLIIDYANSNPSSILPNILRRLEIDVVELNANLDDNRVFLTAQQFEEGVNRLARITPVMGADMGVRLDSGGEKLFLVDDAGRRLSGMQALAAVTALVMSINKGGSVAVPVTAPRAFEQIAERYGGKIIRTRATLSALMRTAVNNHDLVLLGDGTGCYIFPSFYPVADGLYATVKIMELLALRQMRLSQVIYDLPPYYMDQVRVPCRWEHKGKVMRILNQQYHDRKLKQIDGIKIDLGDEWVLILPDPDGPFFYIIAEGSNEEQAQVLTEKYAGLVTGLQ
ncbi:MAG: nucleotidyltransferase [Chloroflexi bacterium AL-W]|nr:nucleotidyltransferase [Chloroflexi bacterium AL-N1]NOK68443.1 nucleotidyltransferase [Chloroflexi bacterium AL-N10]NOK74089.1 nucleotidyltransferase [Chloroflexi bacterium AL-N5]NOK83056.1 nucleotidyltransferase [Chloroflexi bacterium AL-W]NOK90579.1 nucleotidyltransferase [Chloroflexi bacterium AL-N15]